MVLFIKRTIVLFLLLCYIYSAVSQCILSKPEGVEDKEFPDMLNVGGLSYTVTVEVSYRTVNKTIHVVEYYDVVDSNGRVDMLENGALSTFIYFNSTKEAFSVEDFDCELEKIDNASPFTDELVKLWVHKEDYRYIFGPSAALRKGYLSYKTGEAIYMGVYEERVRGIKTDYWQQCIENNHLIVRYFFAVANWTNEYGSSLQNFPVRIEILGETGIELYPFMDQIYDFVKFMPYVANSKEVIAVPIGIGCSRGVDLKKSPSYENLDLSYQAEIIYQPDESKYSYITSTDFALDQDSSLVAFHYLSWSKPRNDGQSRPYKNDFIVHDQSNGFTYTIDTDSKECTITVQDSFNVELPYPGMTDLTLDLKTTLLFASNEKEKYMGQVKKRGLLTDVYETKAEMYGSVYALVDRFLLTNDEEYNTGRAENNAPVQVIMRFIDSKQKTSSDLIINISGFSTSIEDKSKAFDVSDCVSKFPGVRWIEFTFAVVNDQALLRNMEHMIPAIQSAVYELLITYGGLTPLRISKILIDFDVEGVYASSMLLERPDYLMDFKYIGHASVNDPDEITGMVTTKQCAKLCLDVSGICYGFSHCGKTCYLKTKEDFKATEAPTCVFYRRNEKIDIYNSIPTLNTVAMKLASAFENGELEIMVSVKDDSGSYQNKKLKVTEYNSNSENVDRTLNGRLDDFDVHYVEHKYGYKLKKSASHVKTRGQLPYLTCQAVCLADPECESMSSCTGKTECLISSKHGDDISESDYVSSSNCIVLRRNYVDAFKVQPGLILASKSKKKIYAEDQEECAKYCLSEKSFMCKSFDFCPHSANTSDKCLLHTTHSLDVKEEDLAVDSSGLCGHYSRNFVFDFKKVKGDAMAEGSNLAVEDATIEECAKMCIEDGAFTCYTFDYCRGSGPFKSSCHLSNKTRDEIKFVTKSTCNTYHRPKKIQSERKSEGKNYSSAAAAGLGFFFFLIGIGMGVVIVFAYGFLAKKKF